MTPPTITAAQPSGLPRTSRRDFLALGTSVLGALALLEIGGMSLAFLAPRVADGEFGGMVNAGAVDSFPAGTVTEFPAGRFFLVRMDDGGFLAIYRRCTHLGCAVSWEVVGDRFVCPCHGSHFATSGEVENPPAPRALDLFSVKIREGEVLVDTSRPIGRKREVDGQAVYA